MGDPTPPQLPAQLPRDIRDFLECRATTVTFTNGTQPWLDGQDISILPGKTPDTAKLDVYGFQFDASIASGGLTVDWGMIASNLPGLKGVVKDANKQLDGINAWFKHNGYKWGPPRFDGDRVTLVKTPLPGGAKATTPPATTTPPASPKPNPQPKPQPKADPKPEPKTDYTPAPLPPEPPRETATTDSGAPEGDQPTKGVILPGPKDPTDPDRVVIRGEGSFLPYKETKVDSPTFRPGEIFAPPADDGTPLEDLGSTARERERSAIDEANAAMDAAMATAIATAAAGTGGKEGSSTPTPTPAPAIGAGGPGGPKAPRGLGRVAVIGVVAVVVAALAGVVLFGGGTSPSPGSSQTANATPKPVTPMPVTPAPATPKPPPTEVATIGDMLAVLGVDEATSGQLQAAVVPDPMHDWLEQGASIDPVQADLVASLIFEATIGSEFLARLPSCSDFVVCAAGADGAPGTALGQPGDYYVYMTQMRGPVKGAENLFLEAGITFFNPTLPAAGKAEAFDRGPVDFLTGTNGAYSVRFPAPATGSAPVMYRLVHSPNEFFHAEPSKAFAVIRGDVLGVFIRDGEKTGVTGFRLYAYAQQTQPAAAVSDTTPGMPGPLAPFDASLVKVNL